MKFFNDQSAHDNPAKILQSAELNCIEGFITPLPPTWNCLFVEGFHELFIDIPDEERDYILNNLEIALKQCLEQNIPYFIEYMPEYLDIDTIKNFYPYISTALLKQIQTLNHYELFKDIYISNFIKVCQERGLQTLLLGGNFGDACVWSRACRLSEFIFAQTLPKYTHPNIRFGGTERAFKYVVIDPAITQGHHPYRDEDSNKLDTIICFPPIITLNDNISDDVEDLLLNYYEDNMVQSPSSFAGAMNQHIIQAISSNNNRIHCSMETETKRLLPPNN